MLRPAHESDLPAMRAWRNQDANREVSNHRHVITEEEHRAWWERTVADPSRVTLILEIGGEACGVVSFFDLEPAEAPREGSWGFYLDHDRLAASGSQFLVWTTVMKDAIAYAFDELGLEALHAEVLEHNESVRALNRRYRFTEGTPEERQIDGRRLVAIPVTLLRENRRGRATPTSEGHPGE